METINHDFYVSFEVAKLLKEAGFDWETEFGQDIRDRDIRLEHNINFNSEKYLVSLPTLDVALRWLREVKNIAIYVCPSYESIENEDDKWIMKWEVAAIPYDIESDDIDLEDTEDVFFDTYEEAQEAGIKEILELILEKGE